MKNQSFGKILILLISVFLGDSSASLFGQKVPCRLLQGTWKIENKDLYEEWETVTGHLLKGKSYKKRGEEIIITEYLMLQNKEGTIIYSARVPDQNEGATIDFRMSNPDDKTWVFENPEHDFPQKIVYKHILENKIHVEVTGADNQGFEYNMYRIDKRIPEWFLKEMERTVGRWIADNKDYQSSEEPFDHYVIDWKWGENQQEITGKLYGKTGEKISEPFWEFRQFWDASTHQAWLYQENSEGVRGMGSLLPDATSMISAEQKFSDKSGQHLFTEKHVFQHKPSQMDITSYRLDPKGKWQKNRFYSWQKQE